MLWLCITLTRLPLDALSICSDAPLVVTTLEGRTRRIVVGNRAAERLGFKCGLDYTSAITVCPQLQTAERSARAEAAALQRLNLWAYQWSSFVTHRAASSPLLEHSAIWLEIAASFKLFGGRDEFLKQLEESLKKLGYSYRLGVACTLEGAALLARAQRRVIAETPGNLRRQLAPLSVDLLSLPTHIIDELKASGVRILDLFLSLPRTAIARRFGPSTTLYLQKLLGETGDPRIAFQLPKKYFARCEFGAEITHTEALLFPLRRMLQELQGYLRAIDGGLQRFDLLLKHRNTITRVPIGLSTASRDAEQFLSLIRERLERLMLIAPVISMALRAKEFSTSTLQQSELFAGAQTQGEQFQHLIDKLAARLGGTSVQSFALIADHRPEAAWQLTPPQSSAVKDSAVRHSSSPTLSAPRPLWLLAEPRRITTPLHISDAPERIAAGWWADQDIARDYFFVRASNGAGCWVFRDLASKQWYLHGLCG